jgi:dihydroorotate dehydrogenase (NAD+) catalytic subunit
MSHNEFLLTDNKTKIPVWNRGLQPLYDIEKSYLDNSDLGPFFTGNIPERTWPAEAKWIDFLGFPIASPLGIPAGPLLNSKWTGLASALGYDVLCYKTIRNFAYNGHSLPNIVFVDSENQLLPGALPEHIKQKEGVPSTMENIGITNSFGMPSRSPEYLRFDIAKANAQTKKGQVLIVSIVGSPTQKEQPKEFISNFIETACFAKDCGAKIIEANFSCPNVSTGEGCIYYNPDVVQEISTKLVKALNGVPLIIKVGIFPEKHLMKRTFMAAAKAGVRGISGINTISMKVINEQGDSALGDGRLTSGICGSPIRQAALDFIQQAREIIQSEKLGLTLIGTGGVTLPEHFNQFLQAGADVVMTATGMMWDPYLALRYHELNSQGLK